jgi:hypothetical protein
MANAEKLLNEQLNLQYDMEPAVGGLGIGRTTANVSDRPPAKKGVFLSGLVGMGANAGGSEAAATVSPAAATINPKRAAVRQQMDYWLGRRPSDPATLCADDGDGRPQTMVQFWAQHPDCLLRRVALRVGAFMGSQCATERVNKLPKEIWSPDRRALLPESVCRDVFVRCNDWLNFHPPFTWK